MADDPTQALRSFSYGGGVQSTAALVLAAQGRINFPLFLFANTGDDSESATTLRYVREVAMPYASRHGIELVEVAHPTETLRERVVGLNNKFPLPAFGEGGMPMHRTCTRDFKIAVIDTELRRRGASIQNPAVVGLGISVDEIQRARTPGIDPQMRSQFRVYPLLDLGLHRSDCRRQIRSAGLPIPPKSACKFCPFHDREAWRRMRRDEPDEFSEAVAVESLYRSKLKAQGLRDQFLTRHGRPLIEVVDEQPTLDGMECESGWCFT